MPLSVRLRAAIEALPFESPKLSATAVVQGNDFTTLLDARLNGSRRKDGRSRIALARCRKLSVLTKERSRDRPIGVCLTDAAREGSLPARLKAPLRNPHLVRGRQQNCRSSECEKAGFITSKSDCRRSEPGSCRAEGGSKGLYW